MPEHAWRQPPTYPSRALLLTLLGNHFQGQAPSVDDGRRMAVASSTFVDVLGRVEVSEQATRATLNRAVKQGFLHRHQQGRQAFFDLTDSTRRLLADGAWRLYHTDPVRTDWDGTWTLLAFSLPESRRTDRHRLRVRLAWVGFGALRDGLWVAPGTVDVPSVIADLGVTDDVHVFAGPAVPPVRLDAMIAEAWDLASIAECYRTFLARWDRDAPLPDAPDDLARWIWLVTEWRLLLVDDPVLPPAHLPDDWPAVHARDVFDRWFAQYQHTATPLFEQVLATPSDHARA
jgi:phenylacetic acid degradation operon negative regulatory protein